MKYDVTNDTYSANGTSLRGYVVTYYHDLVEMFGQPLPGGDKTNAEWIIEFDDGLVATIYDWKTYEAPMDKYEWHIGGKSYEVVERIQNILEGAKPLPPQEHSSNSWSNWEN